MSIDGYRDGSVDKAVEILNKKGFGIERIGRSLNAPVSGLDIGKKTWHTAPMMSILKTRVWLRLNGQNHCRTSTILIPN